MDTDKRPIYPIQVWDITETEFDIKNIPAPHILKAKLDEFVIGQDQAKKAIAVAVYNHYKRVATKYNG